MPSPQSDSVSLTASSISSPATPVADNFEAVAAAIEANPQAQAIPQAAASAEELAQQQRVATMLAGLTPENIAKWIEVGPNLISDFFKDPQLKLMEIEKSLIVGPATVIAQQKLPDMLKQWVAAGHSPEVGMFCMGVMFYGGRVWLTLKQRQEKKTEAKPGELSGPKLERNFTEVPKVKAATASMVL